MKGADVRPNVHFTPGEGWINDPLGLSWHNGQYHLFFQYVPGSSDWAPNCHWGHAVSKDLLSWEERPLALKPGDGDDGVWSGSLVMGPDCPVLFFTAVSSPDPAVGRMRAAKPNDESWDTWLRVGGNVAEAPEDLDVTSFRDPFVFFHEPQGAWRMIVGASIGGDTAAVVSYSSKDLEVWHYEGVAAARPSHSRDPLWVGSLWECPQLLKFADTEVLLVSVWDADQLHYSAYVEVRWEDGVFEFLGPWRQLTFGQSYYAAMSFRDKAGNHGLMHWLRGVRGEGWTGAISAPQSVYWENGYLKVRPHAELIDALTIRRFEGDVRIDEVETTGLVEWSPKGLSSIRTPHWSVRTSQDSIEVTSRNGVQVAPWDGTAVSILVDAGCIEVFAGISIVAAIVQVD